MRTCMHACRRQERVAYLCLFIIVILCLQVEVDEARRAAEDAEAGSRMHAEQAEQEKAQLR